MLAIQQLFSVQISVNFISIKITIKSPTLMSVASKLTFLYFITLFFSISDIYFVPRPYFMIDKVTWHDPAKRAYCVEKGTSR